MKLRDVNGDGKINEDDRVVYQKDPDATFSLSTNLRWKGFDFFMDWYAVAGGYILNPLMYDGEYGGDLRGRSNGMKVDSGHRTTLPTRHRDLNMDLKSHT